MDVLWIIFIIIFFVLLTGGGVIFWIIYNRRNSLLEAEGLDVENPDIVVSFRDKEEYKGHFEFCLVNKKNTDKGVWLKLLPRDGRTDLPSSYEPISVFVEKGSYYDLGRSWSKFRNVAFILPVDINLLPTGVRTSPIGNIIDFLTSEVNSVYAAYQTKQQEVKTLLGVLDELAQSPTSETSLAKAKSIIELSRSDKETITRVEKGGFGGNSGGG